MKTNFCFIFVIFIFSSITFGQTTGKIFTKDEADKLYGDVIVSVQISVSELNSIISQSQNNVMFRIKDKQLVFLGDNRKVLLGTSRNIDSSDVFAVCSKSKLLELLNYGDDSIIYFEQRTSRPTITFGMHTLEQLGLCPPYCN